ncbi:ATP-binding protein [Saccharothrix obliqua]|uniref:ATP-binding protein n=1 Tax=Saccharothrix obliqua TaxID=2861747 RepID=UPI001C5FF304|nr:ATP-binding protein [Saccharothrix obliqua]MBW4718171.1 ATP-binding protein [Saccharothrix obliqua]
MTLEPVNPFAVPHLHGPVQPLRPFAHDHDGLYVRVDDGEQQYLSFQRQMGDLRALLEIGRTVLAIGESGCGKTALLHRCAAWVIAELGGRGVTAKVVDATRRFLVAREMPSAERLVAVCDHLYDLMRQDGLIRPDADAEFKENRREPYRVYQNLGGFMPDDHVLILLLPSPKELWEEVVQYAGFAQGRVLFLMESDMLADEDVARIRRDVAHFTEPVVLQVGPLVAGDVERFVTDRLGRRGNTARFPRLSDEAIAAAGRKFKTVAQLQLALHSTYQSRMDRATGYENDAWVTAEEILEDSERRSVKGSGTS